MLQTAFALVMLAGASHFVRSLWNVHTMDLGIQADNVLSVWAAQGSTGCLTTGLTMPVSAV